MRNENKGSMTKTFWALGFVLALAVGSAYAGTAKEELVTVSEDSAILSSLSGILPDKTTDGASLAPVGLERVSPRAAKNSVGPTKAQALESEQIAPVHTEKAHAEKVACPISSGAKMGFVPKNCQKSK